VQQLGSLDLSRVAIQPGKPIAVGRINDTPFLACRGTPSPYS